jgi:tRNA-intron endonuclease
MAKNEEIITGTFSQEIVIAPSSDLARELYDKSRLGEPFQKDKFQYALVEALYLIERGKMIVVDGRNKEITFDKYTKKAKKSQPKFFTRYSVYKDMRNRGYIVKTALKFGADFRVYDRGVKPGEDHAKWILYPVSESEAETWYNFSAKNRVAHSTRKKLLVGIVDAEGDVTYYTIKWEKP